MEKEKEDEPKFSKEIISNTLYVIFDYFFWLILTSILIDVFSGSLKILSILLVIDTYVKLIISSWPAAILIISLLVLHKHHEAINHFIRNRMTEIGPSGLKGEAIKMKDATESEVKQERIKETKEDDRVIEGLIVKNKTEIGVETGFHKAVPKSTKEELIKKYQKISQIEEVVQTNLIDKYADRYKSQVKITDHEKSVIVDGILYSKNNKKPIAIEIKFISSKNYEAIRFIIARKKTKLAHFGINKLILIIVGDNITIDEAMKIQEDNIHQAKIYFYNWDNGILREIEIPSRNEHLF